MSEDEFYIYKRSVNYPNFPVDIKKEEYLGKIFEISIYFISFLMFKADCIFCIRINNYNKKGKRKEKGIISKITIICKNFNQNSVLFLITDLIGETKILAQNLHELKFLCDNK